MQPVQNQDTKTQPEQPRRRQAEIFADEYTADAGKDMINMVKGTRRRSTIITAIVLAVSMPHQVAYLVSLCIPYLHFDTAQRIIESVGMLMIAGSVPVVSDIAIVSCIHQISTVALSKESRWRAVGAIITPLGVSGYVNFAAPGPELIKFLAAFLVSCILVSEVLKFAKPNFRAFDEMIADVMAQVKPEEPQVRRQRFNSRKDKVLHVLANEPHLKVVEVAKKVGVSPNYVHSIRREQRQTAVVRES